MTDRAAALQVVVAIAEALRALGSVPSGEFFVRLCAMPALGHSAVKPDNQSILEV